MAKVYTCEKTVDSQVNVQSKVRKCAGGISRGRIPPPRDIPHKHNAEIDFMKLIASITIMFHHSIYATNSESSRIWAGGYVSVAFFFCISGYLMASSVFKLVQCSPSDLGKDTAKFMLRKLKSIFPWYLFAWIMSFCLLCIYYGSDLAVQAKMLRESMFPTLLVHMTGLDGFEVVGAIWYLSAMYLCMPMLYAIMRANKNLFVWVIAPLLTLFLYGYMHKVYGGIWWYLDSNGLDRNLLWGHYFCHRRVVMRLLLLRCFGMAEMQILNKIKPYPDQLFELGNVYPLPGSHADTS